MVNKIFDTIFKLKKNHTDINQSTKLRHLNEVYGVYII